ncbi:hypothetical protein SO802_015882 [Lithocarpus litseifolius]|uniref:Uncharacterized protein n=1 Tax=Lithocarpus litseifolius TaxID=425828 RepID=A0AAW2CYK7_9ROSI
MSSSEKKNKGKAPVWSSSQTKRPGKSFERHEGASSMGNQKEAISLHEFATMAYSSGNPYSTTTTLNLLHSAYILFIKLTSHNQISQLLLIIKETVTTIKSPFVSIRCWSTIPKWEMDNWATVQPSKHLVFIGGYSHQGPWFEGNSFLSFRNPQALIECWRSYFNNEIHNVTKELWKNYYFIGNIGRISVFSTRPYYESTSRLSWVHNCDLRRFMILGTGPIYEPLIYCGLCEQFTTFHEHPYNDDPLWESLDDDFGDSFN